MNITILVTIIISTFPSDHIDEALEMIGLTKETAKINLCECNFFGDEKYRLQFFDMFMDNPYKIPDYTDDLATHFAIRSYSVSKLLVAAADLADVRVRHYMIMGYLMEFNERRQEEDLLYSTLLELCDITRKKPDKKQIKRDIESVPEELAYQLSRFLFLINHALKLHELAFEDLTEDELHLAYSQSMVYASNEGEYSDHKMMRDVELPAAKVNYGYLYMGALYVAVAVDSLYAGLKHVETIDSISVAITTPCGDIIINGAGNDSCGVDRCPMLVIDFGGDDQYFGNTTRLDYIQPVSIVIDLAGNDHYENNNKQLPSFGGALFNYSYLVDAAGDDVYRSVNVTQGAGMYGVGVLYDNAGDDSLFSRVLCQGAGSFGLGMLINLGGSDYYEAIQQAQGLGFVKGCGILLDDEGDDIYVANDSDIVFPASEGREHNVSFAQGMGIGKRADMLDGNSYAGGIGFLVDRAGHDQYSCGAFGQGCGLWFGCGLLADKEGNDEYFGASYVQGSGPHFSISVLCDNEGNDIYTVLLRMAQGVGKDCAIGFFVDGDGNDQYNSPESSLGIGQANGIGIFWDKAGNDVYTAEADYTMGFAEIMEVEIMRHEMFSIGLFIDGDGKDTYSKPFAENNFFWTQSRTDTISVHPMGKYIGVDF